MTIRLNQGVCVGKLRRMSKWDEMRRLESGLTALLLACALAIWPSHSHAVSFEPLDEAARGFSLRISSAASGHFTSTASLHVLDLDSSVHDSGLVMAHKFIEQAAVAEFADSGRFHIVEATGAALTADLLLRGSVTEVDGGLIVVIKLVDRRNQAIVAADQRWISTDGLIAAPAEPGRQAPAPGAARRSTALQRPEPAAVPAGPRPSRFTGQWLVFGGPGMRGRDLGWNLGLAYRPETTRWEAALEAGDHTHEDVRDFPGLPPLGAANYRVTANYGAGYMRARLDCLREIRAIKDPWGETILDFPGYIKAGTGLGVYSLRERTRVNYGDAASYGLNSEDIRYRLRVAPMLDFAVARKIGAHLELQASGEYIFESERFGPRNYTLGGLGWLLQLFYRI